MRLPLPSRAIPRPVPFTAALLLTALSLSWTPLPVRDDPLVRMPGTQPDQGITLEGPDRCTNCHAGYNKAAEPGHNWKGSMMAQAARDPLFWSCLTVSLQDSIWKLGNPNAGDICLRCHFPKGWTEGRSDPTSASLMTGADYDGVQCDFCHSLWNPFYKDTHNGTREGSDWTGYWDESNASGTPSQPAADSTRSEDALEAPAIRTFNGLPFFVLDEPGWENYDENASGQYFVNSTRAKRGPFADAEARHQMLYSRYHKSKYFCSSCHDVSNPVFQNLGASPTAPLPTETDAAWRYFHVERTFSEFQLSSYGQPGGASGRGAFASLTTSHPGNRIASCQDCHMRDVTGAGCNKSGTLVRKAQSVEHPQSGQPLHDMTGGNVLVSWILASTAPTATIYDRFNERQLRQGPGLLTFDLSQGLGIDPVALLDGKERAEDNLEGAASLAGLSYNASTGALSVQVQNNTGHKLITGFSEGRRVFLNVRLHDAAGNLLHEINPYDWQVGTLKGLPPARAPKSPPLGANEAHFDELVYEMHTSTTQVPGETETFHFVLADGRYKDNRIPPVGFDVAAAAARQSLPVWHGVEDPNFFTGAEYTGGYDQVSLSLPAGAAGVEVRLYYQTTSLEYVDFLVNEIRGNGPKTLPPSAYVIQTDPFFAKLRAWGDTLDRLWRHNRRLPGAWPQLMTRATWGTVPASCDPDMPTLTAAKPGNATVTLTWSNEHAEDPMINGYRVYLENGLGELTLEATLGKETTYIDTGLSNGSEYCYRVEAVTASPSCVSPWSNTRCATPAAKGGKR